MDPASSLAELSDRLRGAGSEAAAASAAAQALRDLDVDASVDGDQLQVSDRDGALARTVIAMYEQTRARLHAEQEASVIATRLATNERIAELGSYDWHIPTDTNTWSDQLYRIYGYEPGAFNASYEKFMSLVHPDDRERIQQVHQECLETGEPFETEERIVRPDGEVRLLWTNGVVVSDEDGSPIRFVGTCRDVTEQRRAEQAHQAAVEEASRQRAQAREAQLARAQSLELNDNVVQGLVTAKWLLAEGEIATAMNVVGRTLNAAQSMIDDLLVTQETLLGAGDLVRSHAAPSFHLPTHEDEQVEDAAVRVVIADDSEDVRMLLRIRLERSGGIEVVGEAANGQEAVDLVDEHRPDVVILDLAMPEKDGLQAAAEIRETNPDIRIVILSAYGESVAADLAQGAGADEYLTKSATFDEVVESVRALVPN